MKRLFKETISNTTLLQKEHIGSTYRWDLNNELVWKSGHSLTTGHKLPKTCNLNNRQKCLRFWWHCELTTAIQTLVSAVLLLVPLIFLLFQILLQQIASVVATQPLMYNVFVPVAKQCTLKINCAWKQPEKYYMWKSSFHIQWGSEIWTSLNSERDLKSGFWMVGTIALAIAKAQPLEIWPLKSLDFKCFQISNGGISDSHCDIQIPTYNLFCVVHLNIVL